MPPVVTPTSQQIPVSEKADGALTFFLCPAIDADRTVDGGLGYSDKHSFPVFSALT